MLENYSEPEDLLSDPSFLSWYFKNEGSNDHNLEDWMTDRPDRKLLVQKAVSLLEAIRMPEKEPSPLQIQQAEKALFEKIESLDNAITPNIRKIDGKTSNNRLRWIAAASILIILTAGMLIVKYDSRIRPEVRTPFGQISSRQLPDGTEVTMNANSRLSYAIDWKDGEDREVWVDGEAFFHVMKTPLKSRFIVHTEHFDIIVTGTQFNVSNRHGKDNVLLQEGSVTLRTKDGRMLMMRPGDFVAFDSSLLERKIGCQQMLLAWKEQKLILDHTTIGQLASIISDLYGTRVRLEGDSTPYRTVTAVLPNDNLNILVKTLEATADFDIVRDSLNNEIVIRAHGQKD